MHVLMALIKVDSQFAGSGISRAVEARCRMLTRAGHRVTVAASFDDPHPTPPCDGVELLHVPLRRLAPQRIPALNDFLHGRSLGKAIDVYGRARRVDLLDVQEANVAPGTYRAARRRGLPVSHSIHLSALYGRARFGIVRRRVLVGLNLWAAKRADRCIAVSRCVKRAYVERGIADDLVDVVYPAVHFPAPAPDPSARHPRHGLWISRMVPGKGVTEAVEAAKAFVDGSDDTEFTFVGGGALESLVRDAADSNPRIHALGFVRSVEELDRLRAEAGFFVATSEHETFGLSVAEAMAAGLPVVASDIDAHREVLGDVGGYYSPGDSVGLRRAIEAVAGGDRDGAVSRKTYERAVQTLREDVASKSLLESYAKCIAAGREVNRTGD